ncbi:MAG TPA: hypothetical protein VGH19_17385 [Verrucomicrobiae bacterium]
MPALAALASGQPAGDLAAMLEHIEMPPRQFLGVVITEDRSAVLRTALRRPQPGRLGQLQFDQSVVPVKPARLHLPVHPQAQ